MDANELLKEVEKENKMKQGNISLILDGYNDLFSDFDPRSYSERTLSDDFLVECRRAARDKQFSEQGFELRLMVPKDKRKVDDENKIKKRLKVYFLKHYHEKQKEIRGIRFEGIIWFFIGVIFIILAALVEHFNTSNSFILTVFFVILEPAGWFTSWSGLDKIFLETREKKPDYDFYRKMATVEINFISY